MSQFYLTALQLSLCLGPMAMGIFITMKVFNIPDITTDGSYTLGATVTAILLMRHWPVMLTLPVCMLAGAVAGVCTGLIHTKLKIDALLAGNDSSRIRAESFSGLLCSCSDKAVCVPDW